MQRAYKRLAETSGYNHVVFINNLPPSLPRNFAARFFMFFLSHTPQDHALPGGSSSSIVRGGGYYYGRQQQRRLIEDGQRRRFLHSVRRPQLQRMVRRIHPLPTHHPNSSIHLRNVALSILYPLPRPLHTQVIANSHRATRGPSQKTTNRFCQTQ